MKYPSAFASKARPRIGLRPYLSENTPKTGAPKNWVPEVRKIKNPNKARLATSLYSGPNTPLTSSEKTGTKIGRTIPRANKSTKSIRINVPSVLLCLLVKFKLPA